MPKFLLQHPDLDDLDLYDLAGCVPQKINMGHPMIREVTEPLGGRHGEWDVTQFMGGRVITIEVVLLGADFKTNLRLLKRYLNPAIRSTLTYQAFTGDDERWTTVRAMNLSAPLEFPSHAVVTAQWKTSDPALYSMSQSTLGGTGAVNVQPGRQYPLSFPRTYPAGDPGTPDPDAPVATNNGDLPAWPIITITGPITNPIIQNIETGQSLYLNSNGGLQLSDGQQAVIDMREHTVMVGQTSHYDKVDFTSSSWWAIMPGTQTINLAGSGASTQTATSVVWYDPYL